LQYTTKKFNFFINNIGGVTMRIGVICPSEIAIRRFMPAISKIDGVKFVGMGIVNKEELFDSESLSAEEIERLLREQKEKVTNIINEYGGKMFESYRDIVISDEIDAIYIPLPPSMHYEWAKLALEHGKHVLVEKPSTIKYAQSEELIRLAEQNNLAIHENYMFQYHEQIAYINELVKNGEIGAVRLYRIAFGFPKRPANDFRYFKQYGGGAIVDVGGYMIKYATLLLGESTKIAHAVINYTDEYDVDIYGSGVLVNDDDLTVQMAYGMDNNYKCEVEIWGSEGVITTGRILTAPEGFVPTMTIRKGNEDQLVDLPADDSFGKSIQYFIDCVK